MFKLLVKKTYNIILRWLPVKTLSSNFTANCKMSKENFAKELSKGIEIEMKHTKNRAVAKDIAMDRLYENPEYYNKY